MGTACLLPAFVEDLARFGSTADDDPGLRAVHDGVDGAVLPRPFSVDDPRAEVV